MAATMTSKPELAGRRFSYGAGVAAGATRWASQRASSRISMSGGYSLFVGVMKVALPAAATVLILLLLAWPELTPGKSGLELDLSEISITQPDDLAVLNARFSGFDSRNQPFLVTADVASQASEHDTVISLELPKADIALADGAWVQLSAREGLYDRETQTVDLIGQVSFFHDKGFELHTETARVDLADGSAMGREAVTGQGLFGQIEATGFDSYDQGDRIIFLGPSHLTLFPGAEADVSAEASP